MTYKRTPIISGEHYHVYNRTNAKEIIFNSLEYLDQILIRINYYRFPQRIRFSYFKALTYIAKENYILETKNKRPLVKIYAYAIMPNHYHFLLQQIEDNGINKFVSNLQNSFAKYYNTISSRIGRLFQDRFKAKRLTTIEEFMHVSRYIHLNPVTSNLIGFNELASYPYTSFFSYKDPKLNKFLSTEIIINYFKSLNKYEFFLKDQVNYQKKLHAIKQLLLD